MCEYIQIEFNDISPEQSDLLIALLNEIGFEGFEEGNNILKAFIPKGDFNESAFAESISSVGVGFSQTIIEETNWNKVWESNFEPVIIADFVAIRADFHEPVRSVQYEIIITPKMSFGTGHHATTYMMMEQMRELDFRGKSVFDFGTGTGVLAILAEKLGAKKVIAVDNDEWSIANANENIKRNNSTSIHLQKAGSAEINEEFDIILANINKNVILDNLEFIRKQRSPGGTILLSGLLTGDEQEIFAKCNKIGLKFDIKAERYNWLFVKLS